MCTLIIARTASFQLVLRCFLCMFGFSNQIKSTPHILPLWFRWLTHCKRKWWHHKNWIMTFPAHNRCTINHLLHQESHVYQSNFCLDNIFINSIYLVAVCIIVSIMMRLVIWWYKPLWPKKLINLPSFTSIPIPIRKIIYIIM